MYAYAGNNPISFSDPFGLCVGPLAPLCVRIAIAAMAAAPSLFHIAAEATTGLNSGRGGAGVGGARALGQAGEAAADIIKNTTRIPSATGTAAYRIPDGLTSTTLTEVKNVSEFYRALNEARGKEVNFQIYREGTRVVLGLVR
mgnify:CR=1 FL=1